MSTPASLSATTTVETSPTVAYLRRAIEHAPAVAPAAPAALLGWWTADGFYLCASCAGRILARGCALPRDTQASWVDEPTGVCVCCQ